MIFSENRFPLFRIMLLGDVMQRLRLKADGRIVELRDGREIPLAPVQPAAVRDLRRRAQLTQLEFAAKLGVPVETIRIHTPQQIASSAAFRQT
jgi:hypothetical protein